MYRGIFAEKGNVVEEADAYSYALERCLHGTEAEQQEFKDMLVEWYYSGDWLKEDEEEDNIYGREYDDDTEHRHADICAAGYGAFGHII